MQNKIDFGYLRKYGYEKYSCGKCEGVMWSRVPRSTCPDRPCSKYEFLYRDYRGVNPLSVQEVRERFINFLRTRGHGVVDPYPVLARWRNDIYLTIASIVVFQPAVTDGIVDPPHNPLVIVQPSIRLTDVDNVGLTFGRHLTSFEMGGMHAFNKPDKFVYWVEGIIDNTIDFFTKEIGLSMDDLVFKEGWWEGGGNAGPAPEVLVDGLEVATLVHMMYKVVDGKYVENPVLVVDCGYGIERIAWLTQRTPTGFHAVYGALVDKYKNILGVEEPPHDVLKRIVYETSDKEISSVRELAEVVEKLGYSEYSDRLVRSVYMYATLDHVRTIGLMLADGIVPSNTGEGYLARLLIRRLLRNLVLLGVELGRLRDVVGELVDQQLVYWRGDYTYGKLGKHRDYIIDVLYTEVAKFVDSVGRGISIVDKYVKKRGRLTTEDLVEIYDSHGIPPEFVVSRARELGYELEVPGDFYSMIASRHGSAPLVKEKEHELPAEIAKWASGYPATRRLFHENPYMTKATVRVLGVNGPYVILDQTIMYPWAGGQDHDTGWIVVDGSRLPVKRVVKIGDVIVHELGTEPRIGVGDTVEVEIDWERRYRLMRHHTATHVVLAAARAILGDHVWQAGAEKTVEKARLDITHHKSLSEEEVRIIEDLANKLVNMRIDLQFHQVGKFEAEARYGLKIYQGGAVYSPVLRIVEIPGWDAQACFGTHLKNTSEIGGIKIVSAERIQDGVIRLEFVAGDMLVQRMRELEDVEKKVSEILGTSPGDLVTAAITVSKKLREMSELLNSYRELVANKLVEEALSKQLLVCNVGLVYLELPVSDEKVKKKVLEELSIRQGKLTVLVDKEIIEIAVSPEIAEKHGIDLRNLAKKLSEEGYRGGGKKDHVTLRATRPDTRHREILIGKIKETICQSPL